MKRFSREIIINWLLHAVLILVGLLAASVLFYWVFPAGIKVFNFLITVLIPFVLAWLVSILTKPITDFINKKMRFPRSLAVILMMFMFLLLFATLFILIIARLWVELGNLTAQIPEFYKGAMDLFNWAKELLDNLNITAEEMTNIQNWFVDMLSSIGQRLTQIMSGTVNLIQSTPSAMIFILVIFVGTFFFCRDGDKVTALFVKKLPYKKRERFEKTYVKFSSIIRRYFGAQLCLVGISTVICIIFFFILNVHGAITIGLLVGALDLLPVVGPTVFIIPWAIVSLISQNYFLGVGLIILFMVMTITRNILEPKLVGERVGLHPLATLAALYIGMRVLGLWGLALGPILLAVGLYLYRSAKLTKEMALNDNSTDRLKEK